MKQRFFDKLMTAVCGLMLFLAAALVLLWCFGFVPQEWAQVVPQMSLPIAAHVTVIAVALLLMLLGGYCFTLLFRSGRYKRGFVVQRTDNGQLSISIRAMENLVQKCIDQHHELHIISSRIGNTRSGVVVDLRIGLANGVSIPLAVNALQKQIKQYIQACSGIDVKEVRVQVETANASASDSPFMVHDTLLKVEESDLPPHREEPTPPPPAAPPVQEPVKAHPQPLPVIEEHEERERKPLHQRLFGREPQPITVEGPPAGVQEEAGDIAEEAAEAEAETTQDEQAQEALDISAQEDITHEEP